MKKRIKSARFWAGIVGTICLMLGAFGIEIGDEAVATAINTVCSLLAMFGIISVPESNAEEEPDITETVIGELGIRVENSDGGKEKL